MSSPLQSVAHLLVAPENPPNHEINGMDSSRCAALHNAIYQHGWISSGRSLEDFNTASRSWLDFNPEAAQWQNLHPSVLAFLRLARALPSNHQVHFFYNVDNLDPVPGTNEGCFPEADRGLTLYATHPELASQPDGLVYDQHTHKAIMHYDLTDDLDLNQPWQKLECILTVWIEMIQREKIVALPADVGKSDWVSAEEGGLRCIEGPERDPATGAKRYGHQAEPWTIQPWARKDLEETLELWAMFVKSIEQKMGLGDAEQPTGLLTDDVLTAARIPDGFARKFLSQARRPRFGFIAPGLQVPTAENFTAQPFIGDQWDVANENATPAILIFRSIATTRSSGLSWLDIPRNTSVTEMPCGLYLNPCDRSYRYPQEDGCTLVLPFLFPARWAKMSDRSPAEHKDSLLQAGVNPYNDRHPVQLQAFLEIAYLNLERGNWSVDAQGVADGIDVWREADTEERWPNYVVPLGPGRYW